MNRKALQYGTCLCHFRDNSFVSLRLFRFNVFCFVSIYIFRFILKRYISFHSSDPLYCVNANEIINITIVMVLSRLIPSCR